MGFADPVMLFALLAVPLVALGLWLATQRRHRSAVRFAAADLLDDVAPRPGWRRWVPAGLLVLAVVLGALALGRPGMKTKLPKEQATLIMALDVSISMKATDVEPNRLGAMKAAADQALSNMPEGMRVGVVSFAGSARPVEWPTRDHETVIEAIDSLRLEKGTAIGDGIVTSLDVLKEDGSLEDAGDASAILLMSDGDNQLGTPVEEAAAQAAELGIPVYTVAFGTQSTTIDFEGTRVPVVVNEAQLESIADATGGKYFRALDEGSLERIFRDVGSQVGLEEQVVDLTVWFAVAALVCLLAGIVASLVWFGRIA
ncbi:MAG: VWA domain-containing protein [Acidimicrobiia bacterium]|nr:VWA domain-containing protein [Acidimicrobiia bacterium]